MQVRSFGLPSLATTDRSRLGKACWSLYMQTHLGAHSSPPVPTCVRVGTIQKGKSLVPRSPWGNPWLDWSGISRVRPAILPIRNLIRPAGTGVERDWWINFTRRRTDRLDPWRGKAQIVKQPVISRCSVCYEGWPAV